MPAPVGRARQIVPCTGEKIIYDVRVTRRTTPDDAALAFPPVSHMTHVSSNRHLSYFWVKAAPEVITKMPFGRGDGAHSLEIPEDGGHPIGTLEAPALGGVPSED